MVVFFSLEPNLPADWGTNEEEMGKSPPPAKVAVFFVVELC
jgi:hypothetical protein